MFGTHLDITERKLADQRLEEAQLVLRTVIDTLPQRVAWKSLTGRYFGSNRVFAEDHGYSSLAGLTVHDLGFEAAACLEFEKSDQRVIESGVDVLDQVVQIKNSRLESEWISRSKVLMRNQHGQATGLLVTYLDVTDFKTKELSLAAARDAANAANEAKSEFLATMSHEIRTPLNGILGCAELLQDTGLDSEQQHLAGTIVNCGRGLLHTLNDLLDLSKMTKGELTLEEIEFDPRIIAEEAVRLFVPRAKEKNIEANFVWHIEDPVVLKADPLRLRQVLMNLINNAIKFTDVGHVTLEVRAMPTKSLRLEVIDSGIGIAPEHHEHIFGRFTQVACSAIKTYGGTGLGLAISKQLIDALGGTIGVSSTLGTGSCFWVEMPLHVAPEADTKALPCTPMAPEYSPAEHPQPVDSLAKAKSSARGVRLLLAEDEPTNQFVARRMLEGMGYSIDVVDNGEAAVAKAREVSYAAILMDCRMPILDGIGATKAIRLFEQLQAGRAPVPIIALTAYATEAIQQSCYAAGMNDFLTKPLEASKLRSTLEAWSPTIKLNAGESLSQTATSLAN